MLNWKNINISRTEFLQKLLNLSKYMQNKFFLMCWMANKCWSSSKFVKLQIMKILICAELRWMATESLKHVKFDKTT